MEDSGAAVLSDRPAVRALSTRRGPPGIAARTGPGSFRPRPPGLGNRVGPAGRVPVRRRAGDGPHRHERVLREAQRGPPGRGASRIRRLRPGRAAHRGGAPPALLGGAVRRGGEGAPGRVRHAAAGARRRPADRRPGPHRRLPQHHPGADVEPGQPGHRQPRPGRPRPAGRGDVGRAAALQAGVPEPVGRRGGVPRAVHRGAHAHRGHPARRAAPPAGQAPTDPGGLRRGARVAGHERLRPGLRGAAAAPAGAVRDRRPAGQQFWACDVGKATRAGRSHPNAAGGTGA